MRIVLTVLFLLSAVVLDAQGNVSEDANYFFRNGKGVVSLHSVKTSWKINFSNASSPGFYNKGSEFLFIAGDSLHLFNTAERTSNGFAGINSYSEISYPWFACRYKKDNKNLMLLNIKTGVRKVIPDISSYTVSKNKSALLLIRALGNSLRYFWLPVGTDQPFEVWSGRNEELLDIEQSQDGNKVAYMLVSPTKDSSASIWCWDAHDKVSKILIGDGMTGLDSGLQMYQSSRKLIAFNRTGNKIMFFQEEKDAPIKGINKWETQIWSYLDAKLYPYQEYDLENKRRYASVVNTESSKVFRIELQNDLLFEYSESSDGTSLRSFNNVEELVVLRHFNSDILTFNGDFNKEPEKESQKGRSKDITAHFNTLSPYSLDYESSWNSAKQHTLYLINLDKKNREVVQSQRSSNLRVDAFVSPNEKFLVFYNYNTNNWELKEIFSGKTRSITSGITTVWRFIDDGNINDRDGELSSVYYWSPDGMTMVLTDGYGDLWQVDLSGKKTSMCLTGRYAKNNRIRFSNIVQQIGEDVYVRINTKNYTNKGFCKFSLGNESSLKILVAPGGSYDAFYRKVGVTDYYIVSNRSNFSEPPETLLTTDFKRYSVVIPQDTTLRIRAAKQELIRWTTFRGESACGFLFKPKDFDSTKKYPVIISYYAEVPGGLKFETYESLGSAGNAAKSYLDDGFIVFSPEVRHRAGEVGPSTYDFVVSAAEKIAKLPFVNPKKMGITGGSFGGYQTNYLVTHSGMFAAAVSYCGMSNLFSTYFAINESRRLGSSRYTGQTNTGSTPWQRPDLFIKNSPIFYADRVTTPLLLSHSKDPNVPFDEAVQLFLALRRMGKRVWLLTDYRKIHAGPPSRLKADTVSLARQFFNHYLKDEPSPIWMLEGLPAKYRGIETRTQLDRTGRTPGPGLLMDKEEIISEAVRKIQDHPTRVTDEGLIEEVKKKSRPKKS